MKTRNFADVIRAKIDADPKLKKALEDEKAKFACNEEKFLKVVKCENWHSYDLLNGIELLEEEKIAIKWPNGKTENTKVFVEIHSTEVSDMGHPYTTTSNNTFIKTFHNGQQVVIPLCGSRIKCKRLKKLKGYST
jgi:hypothetical protein